MGLTDLYFFDTSALGYTLANFKKIPFITGDKEFGNLLNVDFVK